MTEELPAALDAQAVLSASAVKALLASEAALRMRVAALEQADREKNDFLAMLAHELRNPLAPIRNVGEVLAQILQDHPAVRRPLAILKRQTDQLTRLVDDLLDISRIRQGRLTLESGPVEIGEVLEHALETVQPLIREREHSLTLERLRAPVCVLGDRARLIQCVANLLQNAAKYTKPGGRIAVSCAAAGTRVSIAVRDNGAGIPASLLPQLFEPFVQSEETLEHSRGGLGIGLAIVKRLVDMHGGSVEAASEGGAWLHLHDSPVAAGVGTRLRRALAWTLSTAFRGARSLIKKGFFSRPRGGTSPTLPRLIPRVLRHSPLPSLSGSTRFTRDLCRVSLPRWPHQRSSGFFLSPPARP